MIPQLAVIPMSVFSVAPNAVLALLALAATAGAFGVVVLVAGNVLEGHRARRTATADAPPPRVRVAA
jgi:hypothetical protein